MAQKSKSVIAPNGYGNIEIRVKDLIGERNISKYELARLTGTRYETIDKWCKNDVSKMNLDVLAKICFVLDCHPSDILIYTKN